MASLSLKRLFFVVIFVTAWLAMLLVWNGSVKQSQDQLPAAVLAQPVGPRVTQLRHPNVGTNASEALPLDGSVLKELPEFWAPPPGTDLDNVGSWVDGEPTIFVGIASYRDPLCHNTIREALHYADKPARLRFGVLEQNAADEANELRCDHTEVNCSDDPSQLLCAHRNQLRLHRVDASSARGPCFGRHRSERLYRGEYFALQLDAHMYFVRGWDTKIISQWRATRNEYAVLSTYPSNYEGSISKSGEGLLHTAPLICRSKFMADGMVRHDAAGEIRPNPVIVGNSPILVPLWGAGISFSRGHRIIRAPYDCCLDMMFVGEEFSMAVRMWTHGYDFYSPYPSVAFHPYNRKKPPRMFWENTRLAPHAATRSARRVLALLGAPPVDKDYDDTEIGVGGKYGLGDKRPLELFLDFFGYDIKRRRARDNCKWVFSMDMHKELVPFLRKNGKGIDYSRVPVKALLARYFPSHDQKSKTCKYHGPKQGFLGGCCQECRNFERLDEAKVECSQDDNCGGIVTVSDEAFELRAGNTVLPSHTGEKSYVKGPCSK